MRSFHTPEAARRYSRNGNRAQPKQTLMIEGESVTAGQIAERLGVSGKVARGRLIKAQQLDGPVTWERLGLKRWPGDE